MNEFFTFLKALKFDLVEYDLDKFYYLARTCLVKDEKLIDKFDIIFGQYFNSLEKIEIDDVLKFLDIPNEWLDKLFEKKFSEEEMKN